MNEAEIRRVEDKVNQRSLAEVALAAKEMLKILIYR